MILYLTFSLVFVLWFAVSFKKKQEREAIGGKISLPKLLWLSYTIFSWFLFPLALLFLDISNPVRNTIILFLASFWVRGIAELFMLYKWHNWKPPYGVTHDLLTFALLSYRLFFVHPEIFQHWDFDEMIAHSWVIVTTVTMLIETYYAWSFFHLVKGNTTGKEGIWFADPHDPVYRRINLITTLFNWPLYLHMIAMILALIFLRN